jgi:hypothetical protein
LEAFSTSFLTNMAGSKQAEIGDSFLVSSPEGSSGPPLANFLFRSGIETEPTKARQGRERWRGVEGGRGEEEEEELAFGGQLWSRLVSPPAFPLCVVFTGLATTLARQV